MRPIFSAAIVMMLATPAFAGEDLIVSSSDAVQADAAVASFPDFTGGVGAADAKDGAGGMIIQMMQPTTQGAAATNSAFAARAAAISAH